MSDVHSLPEWATASRADDDLAAILASRMCHDLSSPLGAIANGVELLILSGAERTPELNLIAESVDSANARLRFFRLAYGTSGSQPIGQAEVSRTLSTLSQGSRHVFAWNVSGDVPRAEIKAVFLLLQCLEAAMPLGGHLQVRREGGTWVVVTQGRRFRSDHPGWDILLRPQGSQRVGAAHVQFALLAGALDDLDRSLDLAVGAEQTEARF